MEHIKKLSSVVLLGVVIVGCSRKDPKDEPAMRSAWIAEPSATAVVANGPRVVRANQGPNGSSLDLKRGEESGAIRMNEGATSIQGKNGTLDIPTNGALPSAR